MDPIDQRLRALDNFKDWSNYLLVTTVAALGWTSKTDVKFCTPWMREDAVLCFALSIMFAILTLALIPHVAEDIKLETNEEALSIYHVYWHGWFVKLRLTQTTKRCWARGCRPRQDRQGVALG